MSDWMYLKCKKCVLENIAAYLSSVTFTLYFNSSEYIVSKVCMASTSHLIASMLVDNNEDVILDEQRVTHETFESLLFFFNTGLLSTTEYTCDAIIEIIILADYIQSDILFEYAYDMFKEHSLIIATCSKFHFLVLTDNLFFKLIDGASDSVQFELWTQYTFKTTTIKEIPNKIPIIWRDRLSQIDMSEVNNLQLSYALCHMCPDVMQCLDPTALIRRLVKQDELIHLLPN